MDQCKIKRRVLITSGIMDFSGSPMKVTGKAWKEQECGVPIFGNQKTPVCKSCLEGWTHKNNFMLNTAENKKLIEKAKKEKA